MNACGPPPPLSIADPIRDARGRVDAGPRGPRWLAADPDLKAFDDPPLEACSTSEHVEASGTSAIVTYSLTVGAGSEPLLEQRFRDQANRRQTVVVPHGSYAEITLHDGRATLEARTLELDLGTTHDVFSAEAAAMFEGASIRPLVIMLRDGGELSSASLTFDAHGERSLVVEGASPRDQSVSKWLLAHRFKDLGRDASTGCDVFEGIWGDDAVHVCIAGDGTSVTAKSLRFDTSHCL